MLKIPCSWAASSFRTMWRSAPPPTIDRGALGDTVIGEGAKLG